MPLHLHNIYKGKQLALIIFAPDLPLVWIFWHHICPEQIWYKSIFPSMCLALSIAVICRLYCQRWCGHWLKSNTFRIPKMMPQLLHISMGRTYLFQYTNCPSNDRMRRESEKFML